MATDISEGMVRLNNVQRVTVKERQMWPFKKTKPPIVDETENQVETPILQNSKEIFCPSCGGSTIVPHFAWQNFECPQCREVIEKYDWLVPDGK